MNMGGTSKGFLCHITLGFVIALAVGVITGVAEAAVGDVLKTVTLPALAQCGSDSGKRGRHRPVRATRLPHVPDSGGDELPEQAVFPGSQHGHSGQDYYPHHCYAHRRLGGDHPPPEPGRHCCVRDRIRTDGHLRNRLPSESKHRHRWNGDLSAQWPGRVHL